MLDRLTVDNYALIRHLEMTPGSGFIIVTGETGAGKSIMLDALSLLLGERADTGVIADKSRKSVIEAVFTDVDDTLREKILNADPEWDGGELIVRREISPQGRSRAFVNDTPVKLSELSEITTPLFDIHSQHSNHLLLQPEHQIRVLDIMADNLGIRHDYQKSFTDYVTLRNRLRRLRERQEESRKNLEMYKFQLAQLEELNPKRGELEYVERRFDILSDAEEIKEQLSEASYLLSGDDHGALSKIIEAEGCLRNVDLTLFEKRDGGDKEQADLRERISQLIIELKDIAESVGDMAAEVDGDPAELSKVTRRMNALYEANKLFRISEEDGLVKLREELQEKVGMVESDENIEEIEKELRKLAGRLKEKGERLTESRIRGAEELSSLLLSTARPLGLPNMQFKVGIEKGKLGKDGGDIIEFLCSFNKNTPLAPFSKIASGGEISRVMLSLRRILAGKMRQPTVIFDEIDTGVSGEIADKMGRMMRDMGRDMQVLSITHLPQVAARGDRHFKVYKHDLEDCTVSEMRELTGEERVREIAGMLSGEEINDAALRNAGALMKDN
ncbi:MAG: DNA repair protein RecN [Muribaculaceae bacterium]|nr:DNA repair protein RecN [Muribaculaceae bacterium]